jgi:hypothetical protein
VQVEALAGISMGFSDKPPVDTITIINIIKHIIKHKDGPITLKTFSLYFFSQAFMKFSLQSEQLN